MEKRAARKPRAVTYSVVILFRDIYSLSVLVHVKNNTLGC